MIRRLNKKSDLKDLIKSCPSGVIDDIYAIEYYIQGHNETIQANFEKKGDLLEVILPSSDLETLPNGILMRRAFYKVLDASYPDGYYNLEFEDNMGVWIGENESEEPVIPEYVTEEELAETLEETLEDYVTDEEFEIAQRAIGALDTRIDGVISSLSDYATQQFVGQAVDYLEGEIQGFVRILSNIDTRVTALEQSSGGVTQEQFAAHTESNDYQFHNINDSIYNINESIDALENAGFITQQDLDSVADSLGQDIQAVQDQVDDIDLIVGDLSDSVSDLDQRVTDLEQGGGGGGTWGSITGDITDQEDLMIEFDLDRSRLDDLENGTYVPTGTATESWVQQQGYITTSDLSGYATESWVQQQGYLTQHQDLTGYATQSWVQNQGYITSSALSGYATQSWVQNQGYITSSALSGYATQSWVSSNYVAETEVWTGPMTEWIQLTNEQRASYKIALVTD